MKTYKIYTEQFIPASIEECWFFFSSPKNLAIITPPELKLKILSDINEKDMHEGMVIEYSVQPLRFIPMRWKTLITNVEKPFSFTDIQISGPYKTWVHKHSFEKKDDGVLMKDEISYVMPLGVFGRIAHSIFIKKRLSKIFLYRKKIIEKYFPGHHKRSPDLVSKH